MTRAEIIRRVAEIKAERRDYEGAHAMEDQLYHDFIVYVAKTADKDLAAKAREVLETQTIDFPRHCA